MNTHKVPSSEIYKRISSLQKKLQENDIDGVFIAQRVDLFYFSGTAQDGYLFIPKEREPLLLIKRYLPRATIESSLCNIVEIESVKSIPDLLLDFYGSYPIKIGFEYDVIPVNDFLFYRYLFNRSKLCDASAFIMEVRMIKSEWEVEQIEKTADLSKKTFEYMTKTIHPGLTEMEFAGMFETFARKHGHGAYLRTRHHRSEAYPWHVLSGENGGKVGVLDSPASGEGTSPAFPCGGGHRRLNPNEPIMIDLGSVLNGYHMDETRMFSIGSIPDKARDASRAAIEIHNNIMRKAKPGVALDELFQFSVKWAEKLGYSMQYLGPPGYKVSFIGHGIGLEMVEPLIIARGKKDRLKKGMVFALEPKMVFKNEFSAGVESVLVITEKGSRLISKTPLEIFIC